MDALPHCVLGPSGWVAPHWTPTSPLSGHTGKTDQPSGPRLHSFCRVQVFKDPAYLISSLPARFRTAWALGWPTSATCAPPPRGEVGRVREGWTLTAAGQQATSASVSVCAQASTCACTHADSTPHAQYRSAFTHTCLCTTHAHSPRHTAVHTTHAHYTCTHPIHTLHTCTHPSTLNTLCTHHRTRTHCTHCTLTHAMYALLQACVHSPTPTHYTRTMHMLQGTHALNTAHATRVCARSP